MRKRTERLDVRTKDGGNSMFTCPHCDGTSSGVVDSRSYADNVRRRKRVCVLCRGRFTTYEVSDEMYQIIVGLVDGLSLSSQQKLKLKGLKVDLVKLISEALK